METLILPGYSPKNKEWAYEIQGQLTEAHVIEWKHWETGATQKGWVKQAADEICQKIGNKKVNILAKSIGTYILMKVLKEKSANIEKIILCGVPLTDLDEKDKKLYQILKEFPSQNLLCIQNENDNHGNFADAKEFLHTINPEITIISKPHDDHDYPYQEDFKKFLTS